MNENFLHFVWKFGLFDKEDLVSDQGECIEILSYGEHNQDSGPDFFNSRIKIGETIWSGNVEIHVHSSDWFRHNHHRDKAYDNVILQVVANHDSPVTRTGGEPIPTLELTFNPKLFDNYRQLIENQQWIPCESSIFKVDPFYLKHWLQKVLVERLEEKSSEILQNLENSRGDWDETFYQMLATNFGFKKNATPFGLLARSLPYKILAKHRNSLVQVEALLFGQAGFLNKLISEDDYFLSLKREFNMLKEKFTLKPLNDYLWKFLRLRPSNFPTIRIAQFAMLIHRSERLFSYLLRCKTLDELRSLFDVSASSYWDDHYLFHKKTAKRKKNLGTQAVDILIINTAIPFLFVYGTEKNLPEYRERALDLLDAIPPEKNSVITKWKSLGIHADNAFLSQALLQLKTKYCKFRRCLDCNVGMRILTTGV